MELHYQHLLSQVTALNERYKKISELTGENFNVFRILNLESSEVRMHSAFMAELLNPNGSHGQKTLFLSLFINHFCFRKNPIDIETCKIEIEKHTGFINEAGTEGGRIDIIISDKAGHSVIIENKIYAGDQNNQLVRYYAHSPNADILYLTLEGDEPSEGSRGSLILDEHFKCISYKKDIIDWLELCRKEVAIMPIIRESLTQYINLIKYLTGQTINDAMKNELSTVILSNLEAAFSIADGLDESLDIILNQFIEQLEDVAAGENMDYMCNVDITFQKNYKGFWFWKNEWKYTSIGFQFSSYDKELIYGIVTKENPIKNSIPGSLREKLSELSKIPVKNNSWWPISYRLESPYDNWEKYDAWKLLIDGTMKSIFKEKITYLLKLTEGVEL